MNQKISKVVSAVAFYWFTSISLVFLNKKVMSGGSSGIGIDAPIFMTWTQIVVAIFGCTVLIHLRGSGKHGGVFDFFPIFKFNWMTSFRILPLTCVFILMIVFNNLCLKYVQVSFYNVARALSVVFNIIISFVLLGNTTSLRCMASVLVVVVGYYMGCEGELKFSWTGVVYGLLASFFVGLYSNMVKKALKYVDDNSWILLIYNNVNAMLLMPVVSILCKETAQVQQISSLSPHFWSVTLFTGIFGFLINIAAFAQIQATSPVTHNVSGIAKSAFQTVLAFSFWGDSVSLLGMSGLVLVFLGTFMYAYYKQQEQKPKLKDLDEQVDEEMAPLRKRISRSVQSV